MIYQLSFRQSSGGAVVPGQLEAFPPGTTGVPKSGALMGYHQVTFLVHGFNVDQRQGTYSLSEFAKKLSADPSSALVFILWPGDSPIGPLSYSFTEGHQAEDTADELIKFIISHMAFTTPINFIAHSLGCRVTMETVKKLHEMANGNPTIYPVNEACLMGAAIDDFSLSDIYRTATERSGRVTVLSSIEDEVLRYIYPLADFIQAFFFFWKETSGKALGYRGPVPIKSWGGELKHPVPGNVHSEPIPKVKGIDHRDYLPDEDKPGKNDWTAVAAFADAVISGKPDPRYP